MMNSRSHALKNEILIPFLIAMVLLIASFFGIINYIMKDKMDIDNKEKVKSVQNMFEIKKKSYTEVLTATIKRVQNYEEVQKYWLKKDKDKLKETMRPFFESLKRRSKFTHICFYDSLGDNYLTMYNLPKDDGEIDNFTMREAIKTHKISSGIEVGPLGTFTLRVAVPWYINKQLVGFIEFGEEIEHIIDRTHTILNVDLFILYKKEYISQERYQNGMEILGRNYNWKSLDNWVFLYSTLDAIPPEVKTYCIDDIGEFSLADKELKYNGEIYVLEHIEIKNSRGQNVAIMLVLINTTTQMKIINKLTYVSISIALGIGVVLFILFYIVLSRVEKNLHESQDKLLKEVSKREKIQKLHLDELEQEKQKLLESEDRFQTIVAHSGPIIFMFDKDGVVKLSEGKMLSNLGYKPGELVGKNVFDVFRDYPDALVVFRRTLMGETFEGVIEIEDRYLESFYSPNKDSNGNIIGVIGIALDITERRDTDTRLRKQAEDLEKTNKELQKSRMAALSIMQDANRQKGIAEKALADLENSTLEFRKLSQVIEQAPISVVIMDTKGKIEYTNPHFSLVTGYSAKEVFGKDPKFLEYDEYSEEFYTSLWNKINNKQSWKGEFKNKTKNGKVFWESASISPILDKDGKTTHFVAVKEDITEKKKIEHELRKAKLEAEAATEAKSRFLASMSHEIRTPMNAIIGLSYLALGTELNPKQFDYLTKIDSSAKSLLKIINDILDFSKIEAGQLVIENINFNLEDVVTSVSNLVAQKVFQKGLELIIHIDPSVTPNLIGDPLRLGQILTNFCHNAVKFTERGEVVIEVALVTEDEENIELLFSVKDTGVGIKEGQKNKLFKAFQQADTSTTREFGGTGLGLVISENIAKLMKGDIWFESKENRGSTFYFSTKFKKQKTEKTHKLTLIEEFSGMNILICDSIATSRELLREKLESFSFNVTSIVHLDDMLEEINKTSFRLIIIDWKAIKLYGIDAFEVMRRKISENIQVILMATLDDMNYVENFAENINASSVMLKPVLHSQLYNRIMEVFGKIGERKNVISDDRNKYQSELEKIRGSLILLAEDNEINQQVAVEMFESVDIQVEIANNGLEAVNMVKNSGIPSKYSLVLMDIQMPEMDGLTATMEIRKLVDYNAVPIVAMTADAMTDVKEKCLDAGMMDYLTKPIEPEKILEMLIRWIKPNKENKTSEIKKGKVKEGGVILMPNIEGIKVKDGLKYVGGDKKLYLVLLEKFLDNIGFENKVNEAIKNNDSDATFRAVHTLKGNAGLLGMNELRDISDKTQQIIKNNKKELFSAYLSEVIETLNPILTSLKEFFRKKESEAEAEKVFMEDVEEKLSELKSLLELRDAEAITFIKTMGTIAGFESEMAELTKLVNSYKFENAIEVLSHIVSIYDGKK